VSSDSAEPEPNPICLQFNPDCYDNGPGPKGGSGSKIYNVCEDGFICAAYSHYSENLEKRVIYIYIFEMRWKCSAKGGA
jgi:hypothetical protein